MARNLAILAVLALIVALPFMFRRAGSDTAWREGDPVLVIVTPHNEAIRYEFEHAFSRWHQAHYGKPVKIEWRAVGGTTEIMRFLAGEYISSARAWWTRSLKKRWPENGDEAMIAASPPKDADRLELYKAFRDTDDPDAVTCRIDLFFGGGQFDHEQAHRQGMTVPPWKEGRGPTQSLALIPRGVSGEIWRTPYLFGNVISSFGICYNVDRLRDLGIAKPPAGWADLANPAFFGQVAATDPTKSGSVAKAFEMIIQQRMHQTVQAAGFSDARIADYEKQIGGYIAARGAAYRHGDLPSTVPPNYQRAVEAGWIDGIHLVQKIGANARYFTDSAGKSPIDVSAGDAAVGMSIDFYGRYQAQASRAPDGRARMIFFTPVGGSSVSCDPISLLRGAGAGARDRDPVRRREKQRELRQIAIRFIEFTLSEEGQKLWCYRPGEPGGPEKYALRRLPIRRDFYPSNDPVLQARFIEHQKHAADDLADPSIDPFQLARHFTYYPRWTARHFGIHRDLIRIMCMDSGEELRETWRAINKASDRKEQLKAMAIMGQMPDVPLKNLITGKEEHVELNWRTAPDISRKYDKMEYARKWTRFFRGNYRKARAALTSGGRS